ncbi:MAG: hypothetical protein ACLTQL_13090 [Eisenbergiella sp.]
MDYTARYGLEFNPFLKNSKEVLVETQEYKETIFRLNYLLATKRLRTSYRKRWKRQDYCRPRLGFRA